MIDGLMACCNPQVKMNFLSFHTHIGISLAFYCCIDGVRRIKCFKYSVFYNNMGIIPVGREVARIERGDNRCSFGQDYKTY